MGNLKHLEDGVTNGKADAVLVASSFHFGEDTIRQVKDHMRSEEIEVRL